MSKGIFAMGHESEPAVLLGVKTENSGNDHLIMSQKENGRSTSDSVYPW